MSRMAPPPHLVSLALNAWACYLVWNWGENPKFEIRNSIRVDTHYNSPMVFRSRRIPRDLSVNRLAAARARLGEIPYDLTLSNPTACGIHHPPPISCRDSPIHVGCATRPIHGVRCPHVWRSPWATGSGVLRSIRTA